jgi:hypothetical protein
VCEREREREIERERESTITCPSLQITGKATSKGKKKRLSSMYKKA